MDRRGLAPTVRQKYYKQIATVQVIFCSEPKCLASHLILWCWRIFRVSLRAWRALREMEIGFTQSRKVRKDTRKGEFALRTTSS